MRRMTYAVGVEDGRMRESFQMRALRAAAEALGGEPRLRVYLDATAGELFSWMRGRAHVPQDVMRTVIDLLADIESGMVQPTASSQESVRAPS